MSKKWMRLVLVVLSILVLAIGVSGCGQAAEKASEKAVEKAIEDSSGGQAKVDLGKNEITVKTEDGTTKVGGAYEWPAKIPADVPKFSAGKIISLVETTPADGGYQVMVGIEGATMADIEQYKGQLEGSGWKVITTTKMDDGYLVMTEKDKRAVMVSFNGKTETGYSGGVYYTEEK